MQDHVGAQGTDGLDRCGAVGGLADDSEALRLQHRSRPPAEARVVVHDQHGSHDLSIFAPGSPPVFSASPEATSVTARMSGRCRPGTVAAPLTGGSPQWWPWSKEAAMTAATD